VNAPAKFDSSAPVVIVGGGFTGLSAAYELARAGQKGRRSGKGVHGRSLASGFKVGEFTLGSFYHHWFTNDVHVMD
jgi:predicted NAD/FAD-dependent oxidoreductase